MRVCFTTICLTCNLFDLLSAPLNDAAFIAAVQARGEYLMQIELPHHYLIDVGWYGGFAAHGTLRVVAVHQHDWEHCLFSATALTAAQTIAAVEQAAQRVSLHKRIHPFQAASIRKP